LSSIHVVSNVSIFSCLEDQNRSQAGSEEYAEQKCHDVSLTRIKMRFVCRVKNIHINSVCTKILIVNVKAEVGNEATVSG